MPKKIGNSPFYLRYFIEWVYFNNHNTVCGCISLTDNFSFLNPLTPLSPSRHSYIAGLMDLPKSKNPRLCISPLLAFKQYPAFVSLIFSLSLSTQFDNQMCTIFISHLFSHSLSHKRCPLSRTRHRKCTCNVNIYVRIYLQRWEFIKENKKVRKQELDQKAIKKTRK